jgi:hypothetical protein
MIDSLEFLPKAGAAAVDIWHPGVEVVSQATEWTQSAVDAGSVDLIAFRDSDLELPYGHNVSYLAAEQALARVAARLEGADVLVVAGQVPGKGVRSAAIRLGARSARVDQRRAGADGASQSRAPIETGGADVILRLDPSAVETATDGPSSVEFSGFAAHWNALRITECLRIVWRRDLPGQLTADLVAVFSGGPAK